MNVLLLMDLTNGIALKSFIFLGSGAERHSDSFTFPFLLIVNYVIFGIIATKFNIYTLCVNYKP